MADDHLRASDAEREQVVDALRDHAAQGRLSTDELEERTGAAYAATTRGELVALRRDLPDEALPAPRPPAPRPPEIVGERLVAVLSSTEQSGHWLVPEHLHIKAVLGDCKVDLRQAELPAEVTIDAKVRLGDITIYVPPGTRVELTGRAILGDRKVRGQQRRGARRAGREGPRRRRPRRPQDRRRHAGREAARGVRPLACRPWRSIPTQAEVKAAGGVVWRRAGDTIAIAIAHRPRYDDWSLPKGKLDRGESWEDAALREVEEEIGLRCRLGEELEPVSYHDRKGRPRSCATG